MSYCKDAISCEVESKEGFYIGDICYALADEVYFGIWGGNDFKDGQHHVSETDLDFAVASTAFGDGVYLGSNGFLYGVDAGNIGIVPLELVEKDINGCGTVYNTPGKASLYAEDGKFIFRLPDDKEIKINTVYYEEEDDE